MSKRHSLEPSTTQNTKDKNMITTLKEAEAVVAERTKYILSKQQGEKSWGMLEHRGMLRLSIMDAIANAKTEKEINDAISLIMVAGDCGNASAYRQSLKNPDGTKMFPGGKSEKLVQEYQ